MNREHTPRVASAPSPSRSRESTMGEEQLASFARAIEQVRRETEAALGESDVAHIRSVQALSTTLEVAGRGLIHFSLEPVSFSIGVTALSAHKALELMEIGHTALHDTYNRLPGAETHDGRSFRWKAPIDEESWRSAHNVRHHQYTNVAGRDPDIDFGGLRLSDRVPHRTLHRFQPLTNVFSWLGFASAINLHVSGLLEVYFGAQQGDERSRRQSAKEAHQAFFRKAVPYYVREFVLFPALAGPFFWKTWLGNAMSEVGRDVCAGAIIYCGHVGARDFPQGTRAGGRGAFYCMQVEAACDTEVHPAVSLLCGGLDRQIEHHLFPRLPPNRLREIAPRVQAICEEHGVPYRNVPWRQRLGEVFRELKRLGKPTAEDAESLAAA